MIDIASNIIGGLLYPFFGTLFGSSFVFFMKNEPHRKMMIFLDSLAAGVMCAASFFSLIQPACDAAEVKGKIPLLLCSIGFCAGMLVFTALDKKLKAVSDEKKDLSGSMLLWAVTLHNIPEGMAVGVVYAGLLTMTENADLAGAVSLSIGIALQNIPEGAIISMPLKAKGKTPLNSFLGGMFSGLAELIAAIITLFVATFVSNILPFALCFAAGAMFFVVLRELSSDFSSEKYCRFSLSVFAAGFTLMMLLDTLTG